MKLVTFTWLAAAALACNIEESFDEPEEALGIPALSAVKLVTFPQPKGEEATYAAALDGSPYVVYTALNSSSTKWTISIQGGGWCYDEVDCQCRSQMKIGTSTVLTPTTYGCHCQNPLPDGSLDNTCNCIFLPYLDGASFSGYRADPWPVPGMEQKLWFRGLSNLDTTLDFAFQNGLKDATEVMVTGTSAGGLSTFLHSDRVAARVKQESPNVVSMKAAPVVGYFLDHDNFAHSDGYPWGPNTPQWSAINGTGANYTAWMNYVYTMQNMTFGAGGGLTEACQAAHPDEPSLCFMSPHMVDFIQTPFFMFNSKYDAWQLENILQLQTLYATQAEIDAVLQYGKDFMTQLEAAMAKTQSGGAITSCICHGCPWNDQVFGNKTAYGHFADWFYGKIPGGAAAYFIDPRTPNGNGTMTYKQCKAFPPVP